MKFGCSLEMVNMRVNGPNFDMMLSKSYWVEMLKLISAAGFREIELPYNPYGSDGIAFNQGRSGMPVSESAVIEKYGSVSSFLEFLNEIGIEKVPSVHISANDTMVDLSTTGRGPEEFFDAFEKLVDEALEFLTKIGGKGLVVSPTPEIGLLAKFLGDATEVWEYEFLRKITNLLNNSAIKAANKGLQVSIKNEFWSLIRGNKIDDFLKDLDQEILYSPDLAHLAIAGVDPVTVLTKHQNRLAYVRFSDTDFEDEENNYKSINAELPINGSQLVYRDLGDGKVDIQACYKVLVNSHYDGWVFCESKKTFNVYRGLLKMRWFIDHVITKSRGISV
ncbi:sugar phosphate isomerase/epimerase family protein [Halalkalibacter alkaliphilus]|uniref:Sugar phosphate isomerase/epimerase n=1 Tax=Halalkalibacter alkaliphilus TaxID=2917993 RepID=A0A9X2CXC2_9BACI|nr:sugar phosphate isomerase/epimerase [Halalkalibacter alkaliphilus]MCL7749765.1 sugar phosphate isomerase/epimerase [Halalkalibacter alkaliphilus]